MKRLIVIAIALFALQANAQDTLTIERDLATLKERGVAAELRSKTAKRNPETGRSTLDLVDAYTKGVIADARGRIVLFITEADDPAWIRTNSIALLEPADALIALLEAEGADLSSLMELNDKWFPEQVAEDDEAARRVWEEDLAERGVPLILSLFTFEVAEDGGVRPSFGVKNISDQAVTGVTIEVLGFSQHGDVVRDRSAGMATHYATLTGRVRPGDIALFSYTDLPLFRNRSTACMEVRKINVTFEDETTATIDFMLPTARLAPENYKTMGECSRVGSE
jgi:hypothetical protein